MASIRPLRLKALNCLRCSIFQTTYNPTSCRTGSKYLRARLRGPSMVNYYPPPQKYTIGQLNKIYPGWNLVDVDEVIRLNDVADKKKRGKGAPKKAKTKADSRRAAKKRR